MSDPPPAPGAFYRPAEVAQVLRCSEWWVKEQARQRRIPFCWIGGGYRFTVEHLAEIARLFEVRPTETVHAPVTTEAETVVCRTTDRRSSVYPVVLRARTPRRARGADTSNPSAA